MDTGGLTHTYDVLCNGDVATTKKQAAVRFSAEAQGLLLALAADTGLSQNGVMELAIRDMARGRGIKLLPLSPVKAGAATKPSVREADTLHTYFRDEVAHFRQSKEQWGGFSNMASCFPITVNERTIRTSEALYQICKFPHMPETQELLLAQRSPIMLARIARAKARPPRADWDTVRIEIMKWVLRLKLMQNWDAFGALLLETGDMDIVEDSHRDAFWGAVPDESGKNLVGQNQLGRLLAELRDQLRTAPNALQVVTPPAVPDFLLFGEHIGDARRHELPGGVEPNGDPEEKGG